MELGLGAEGGLRVFLSANGALLAVVRDGRIFLRRLKDSMISESIWPWPVQLFKHKSFVGKGVELLGEELSLCLAAFQDWKQERDKWALFALHYGSGKNRQVFYPPLGTGEPNAFWFSSGSGPIKYDFGKRSTGHRRRVPVEPPREVAPGVTVVAKVYHVAEKALEVGSKLLVGLVYAIGECGLEIEADRAYARILSCKLA